MRQLQGRVHHHADAHAYVKAALGVVARNDVATRLEPEGFLDLLEVRRAEVKLPEFVRAARLEPRCRGRSGHPPGTSKWNRIEHRLFAFITPNWRGKPADDAVIIQLIASTTTHTGLTVQGRLDQNTY
jgi:hypothetical protein